MILKTTGDIREIGNSAWVSTSSEIQAKNKTDDEVERVVRFLVENSHTSPLEVVTLTFSLDSTDSSRDVSIFLTYAKDKYTRFTEDVKYPTKITLDLLNFTKITFKNNFWQEKPFLLFQEQHPLLSQIIKQFKAIPDTTSPDVSKDFKSEQIKVEVINLHEDESLEHSRVTFRVQCPLSISLQLLRHRKGSFNQSSGRYKTLRYDMFDMPLDIVEISKKAEVDLATYFDEASQMTKKYLKVMKDLKTSKDSGKISNDEYKRMREAARYILPEGRMTELYATFYLDDFYHNYKILRDSVHAQKEHILVAQLMHKALEERKKK